MRGVAKVMDKDVDYFVAWCVEDNPDENSRPSKYRVFRDDYKGKAEPITEAMTHAEAKRKLEEIVLLTRGSEHV